MDHPQKTTQLYTWENSGKTVGKRLHIFCLHVLNTHEEKLLVKLLGNGKDMGEIVAIAFDPLNKGYVVTSFKHGQVGVWKLKDDVKVRLF